MQSNRSHRRSQLGHRNPRRQTSTLSSIPTQTTSHRSIWITMQIIPIQTSNPNRRGTARPLASRRHYFTPIHTQCRSRIPSQMGRITKSNMGTTTSFFPLILAANHRLLSHQRHQSRCTRTPPQASNRGRSSHQRSHNAPNQNAEAITAGMGRTNG